jgi:UDP-N-acetylglucosamine 2-epimerase (non-hydrolysing)
MAAKILCVAGARPNFMKIAPLLAAFRDAKSFEARLVHTGQHYDEKLSKIFFEELAIPRPDVELEVGSGSHAQQTAEIMRRFEEVVVREQPQAVLVVGDVNSTTACALVASKIRLDRPFRSSLGERTRPLVIHVEAGLRSFDNDMPEEINRKVVDAISDLLFVSDPIGMELLAKENVSDPERVFFVGNVMIDTLLGAKEKAAKSTIRQELGVSGAPYGVVTLHRPSNVDDPAALGRLLTTLDRVAERVRLVFPVHPRTRQKLAAMGHAFDEGRWKVVDPCGYIDFLDLTANASLVLTDSGGIQEETTVLGVPCVTLRENTERPCTIDQGTNRLVGTDPSAILDAADRALAGAVEKRVPPLWDGKSAERIRDVLERVFA